MAWNGQNLPFFLLLIYIMFGALIKTSSKTLLYYFRLFFKDCKELKEKNSGKKENPQPWGPGGNEEGTTLKGLLGLGYRWVSLHRLGQNAMGLERLACDRDFLLGW
ncbi:hypothetical protein IKX64_01915 [Candidatus Saccharibacteria bacterium]|nr:hypothetical protein [Candidatus Saccharibacteria bacterium]